MNPNEVLAPRVEDIKHHKTTSSFVLRLLAGSLASAAGPRFMRLDEEQAAEVGLDRGRGSPVLVYGKPNGSFCASAARIFHCHAEPIERAALDIWNAQWSADETSQGDAA